MADNPFADLIPQRAANPFADLIPARQPALSDAITDIPGEIAGAFNEGYANLTGVANRGQQGSIEGLLNTGKAVLSPIQMALSPITGTARSVGGHLLSAGERFVGENVINPIVERMGGTPQHPDPQKMYEAAKGDVDLAMAALGSRGRPPPAAPRPPPLPSEGQEVVNAASRLSGVVGDVNVPRAISSDNIAVQRVGQGIRNIPVVGDAIPRATIQLTDDLGGAVRTIADQYGTGSGPNVASRIGRSIGEAAEAETAAARAAAQRSDDALLADWQRNVDDAGRNIAAREETALQNARRAVGDMSPQEMGANLIARLRQGEQAARANKERLYGIAGESGGSIRPEAISTLRSDVLGAVDFVDPVVDGYSLTPAAARMVKELDNVPGVRLQDMAARSPRPEVAASRAAPSPAPRPSTPRSAAATVQPSTAPPQESLLEFLARKGGLGQDAELSAIGGDRHTVNVPGAGRRKLTRQGGMPLDYAREAAEEAGYLRGDHRGTSTTRDLLDAIDAEMRGNKLFPGGVDGGLSKRGAAARSEREAAEYDAFRRGLEEDLAAAGHNRLSPNIRERVLKDMERGADADTAVSRVLQGLEEGERAIGSNRPLPMAPVDMQTLEQTRKRLGAMARGATNDTDRAAAGQVMRAFDDWLSRSFDNALFHGSDDALNAYRQARAANADWRTRFGFNSRDDADRLINRVVTGEVTPQELSNWLVGATQVGSKGVSSRLLTRIAEATGNDAEAMQAIRGGVWNRLSQATEGATARSPEKVAGSIYEFLNGSGRDVARRLFTPEQQGIMRAYADTIRTGQTAREVVADVARTTKPQAMEVGVGPMQELANAVLGRGGKTDEALFSAIDAYAKSGGRGDLRTLSTIIRNLPEQDRGDLAGAIVRNLGVSPRTGQFSPDVFVSQWQTYTPQAKTLLFGNAGPHRQALDDIAVISDRLKKIGQRFGNPSGTAQNVNMLAAGAGALAAPLTTLASVAGGAIAARILASPAGASSAARWSRTYSNLIAKPSAHTIGAYQSASRNLANTANSLGANVSSVDFLRALQSPATSGAQEQNNVPRPPGQ